MINFWKKKEFKNRKFNNKNKIFSYFSGFTMDE